MASIGELRKKIKGVKSTRQITNAMKMVAAARMGKAQKQMNEVAIFPGDIERVLFSFLKNADLEKRFSPLLYDEKKQYEPRIGVIAIAGDKGLCGDFNNAVVRETNLFIAQQGSRVVKVFAVGTKLADHIHTHEHLQIKPYIHIYNTLEFRHADAIGQDVLDAFFKGDLTDVYVLFNGYVNAMKHQFTKERLLPIDLRKSPSGIKKTTDIEPVEVGSVLLQLLPLWFKSKVYSCIRKSYAAELVARMRAMDNATRNAGTLIDDLTLEMNKVRQAVITRELVEITGTSEVMKE